MARRSEWDQELMTLASDCPWLAVAVAVVRQARNEADTGSYEARRWLGIVRGDVPWAPEPEPARRAA